MSSFFRGDSDLKSGWLSMAFTTSMALHDVTCTVFLKSLVRKSSKFLAIFWTIFRELPQCCCRSRMFFLQLHTDGKKTPETSIHRLQTLEIGSLLFSQPFIRKQAPSTSLVGGARQQINTFFVHIPEESMLFEISRTYISNHIYIKHWTLQWRQIKILKFQVPSSLFTTFLTQVNGSIIDGFLRATTLRFILFGSKTTYSKVLQLGESL